MVFSDIFIGIVWYFHGYLLVHSRSDGSVRAQQTTLSRRTGSRLTGEDGNLLFVKYFWEFTNKEFPKANYQFVHETEIKLAFYISRLSGLSDDEGGGGGGNLFSMYRYFQHLNLTNQSFQVFRIANFVLEFTVILQWPIFHGHVWCLDCSYTDHFSDTLTLVWWTLVKS